MRFDDYDLNRHHRLDQRLPQGRFVIWPELKLKPSTQGYMLNRSTESEGRPVKIPLLCRGLAVTRTGFMGIERHYE